MFDGVFLWLLIGLAVGVVAKLTISRRDPGGLVLPVLLGIAGALLAFYLSPLLGVVAHGRGWRTFAAAAAGAIVVLACYRLMLARRV
jgi:uncharacterized membrane protein YeaQ/YmgE (transglycosylase-associated protein family)